MSEFPKLPRWTFLPGDPPDLKTFLAGKQAEQAEQRGEDEYPDDWPEEPR